MAHYSPNVNTRGLIYADNCGVLLRSSYYVYKLYRSCAGGISVETNVSCPNLLNSNALVLDLSAIKMSEKRYLLFLINRDPKNDLDVLIEMEKFEIESSSGVILTSQNLRDYNSFENPKEVFPRKFDIKADGKSFNLNLPKHSILKIKISR